MTHSLVYTLSLTCFQKGFEELIIKASGASACWDGKDQVPAGAWLGRGWHSEAGPRRLVQGRREGPTSAV